MVNTEAHATRIIDRLGDPQATERAAKTKRLPHRVAEHKIGDRCDWRVAVSSGVTIINYFKVVLAFAMADLVDEFDIASDRPRAHVFSGIKTKAIDTEVNQKLEVGLLHGSNHWHILI